MISLPVLHDNNPVPPEKAKRLSLIQPMHVHGLRPGESHEYLPSSLSVIAAQAIAAGVRSRILDQNLHEVDLTSLSEDVIGINLVGPPYIPSAIEFRKKIADTLGDAHPVMMGGQVIRGLTHEQFSALFGPHTINGNAKNSLARAIGVSSDAIRPPEETSLIEAYQTIADADMRKYLSTEFCLYLSQGCKYRCDFCAADRTTVDPVTNKATEIVEERYRNPDLIKDELVYLVGRAESLGIHEFNIYFSNLDLFQTPEKLDTFAGIVLDIRKRYPGFTFHFRGLSTVTSFIDCHRDNKETISRMVEAGLYSIGYGVDAGTPEVWKSMHKQHNSEDKSLEAIQKTREWGMTPEVLMLFGHDADTEQSMQTSYDFLIAMNTQYGAIPRPYVAKNIVPGNSGWIHPDNTDFVRRLIEQPELFTLLEYSTLPTVLTHPRKEQREAIKRLFIKATRIPGNASHVIYPAADPDLDPRLVQKYARLNKGRFDR